MGANTKIAWADHTWNPWRGCTKVSEGCAHCYAETLVTRRLKGQWGPGAPRQRACTHTLNDPFRWRLKPYVCDTCGHSQVDRRTKGKLHYCERCECFRHYHRARVFPLSLGDWLDPEVPIEWLGEMLDTVRRCPEIDWLLLTKRPELWAPRIEALCRLWACDGSYRETPSACCYHDMLSPWRAGQAPRNVWFGFSAENQQQLIHRYEIAVTVPCARLWCSGEPLLSPLDLSALPQNSHCLDWIVAGGESDPDARPCQIARRCQVARPCHIEWLHSIIRQSAAAKLPCFIKQLGSDPRQDLSNVIPASDITDPSLDACAIAAWEAHRYAAPLHLRDTKGADPSEWPAGLAVREFPNT